MNIKKIKKRTSNARRKKPWAKETKGNLFLISNKETGGKRSILKVGSPHRTHQDSGTPGSVSYQPNNIKPDEM